VIIYDCSKTFCRNIADRSQRNPRKWPFYYSYYYRML